MTTLMRNGRDRRSGKPVKGHAILERALLVGTRSADHIRASGHSGRIATGQASTRKQAGYMAAPERFAKRQIPLAPRAPSIHGPSRRFTVTKQFGRFQGHNGHHRTTPVTSRPRRRTRSARRQPHGNRLSFPSAARSTCGSFYDFLFLEFLFSFSEIRFFFFWNCFSFFRSERTRKGP